MALRRTTSLSEAAEIIQNRISESPESFHIACPSSSVPDIHQGKYIQSSQESWTPSQDGGEFIRNAEINICYPPMERVRRKRRRTTAVELAILEEEFARTEKPSMDQRLRVATRLGGTMTSREIQIWFQNKRQAKRRQISNVNENSEVQEQFHISNTDHSQNYLQLSAYEQNNQSSEQLKARRANLMLSTVWNGKAEVMFDIAKDLNDREEEAEKANLDILRDTYPNNMLRRSVSSLDYSVRPNSLTNKVPKGKENVDPRQKFFRNEENVTKLSEVNADGNKLCLAEQIKSAPVKSLVSDKFSDIRGIEEECAMSLMGLARSASIA